MGYVAQLTIPKIVSDTDLKLYIYRSTNADDINTISKVANLEPIMVIDQSTAATQTVNQKECFVVTDEQSNATGITYYGPLLNTVPIIEYETIVNLVSVNTYTFANELILTPLELHHKEGIVFYYSVIAVDETNNTMSHLSKVNGILVKYIETQDLNRQILSCDNYTGDDSDQWNIVNTIPYDETDNTIRIGDISRPYNIAQLGLPMVETVPKIEEINL